MNLSAIKAFVLSAQLGSISQAARKMGKNRVQVSQWISGLEDDWNTPVFDRTKSSVTLTKSGIKLLQFSERLLEAESELESVAKSLEATNLEQLVLGVSYTLPAGLVSTLVKRCQNYFPDANIHVLQQRDETLLQLALDNQLDMAVLSYMHAHSVPDNILQICEYSCTAVCAANHPLAQFDMVTSKELLKHHFISMPVDKSVALWELPKITRRIEVETLETIKQLAIKGLGFATLPDWLIKNELENGSLVELKHPDAKFSDKIGVLVSQLAIEQLTHSLFKEIKHWHDKELQVDLAE